MINIGARKIVVNFLERFATCGGDGAGGTHVVAAENNPIYEFTLMRPSGGIC
jgi:hypothetical protein